MPRNNPIEIAELEQFPPTVVDHTEYDSGVDLHLLDSGTPQEPRFIRVYNDGRQSEMYL